MTALVLLIAAAWLWLCLVMLPENRMRIALFGLILMPLGLFAVFLKLIASYILRLNRWVGSYGHANKE